MTTRVAPESANLQLNKERWRYLTLGVVCMLMIANLQYGWTLFVLPLQRAHGWAIAEIQFAFTLFVALETWGTPLPGWIADKLGRTLARASLSALAAYWSR
jgi:MFS transporter, OFA family, oxalate/formate antiporter